MKYHRLEHSVLSKLSHINSACAACRYVGRALENASISLDIPLALDRWRGILLHDEKQYGSTSLLPLQSIVSPCTSVILSLTRTSISLIGPLNFR